MQPAVLIRLRPVGPWRSGPGDGGHAHVDPLFGSDRLFSAVTIAMKQLGHLDEWLDATARATGAPALAFTSLFPFQGDTLFAPPPATLWPPPPGLVTTPSPVFLSKLRWAAARFVPVSLVESILLGQNVLADQWLPDPQTACLLRRDRPSSSPFRIVSRSGCAVDRLATGGVHVHTSACIEFEAGAGLWTLVRYGGPAAQEQWSERLESAFRVLADTGFGGRRSSGWGQTSAPEFQNGTWPGVLLPKLARRLSNHNNGAEGSGYWLLSLFSPSGTDSVDWKGGDYTLTVRGGFVHANGQAKKLVRMVAEGSVLAASNEPSGAALDVAADGADHPVYRSGFAVTLRLPVIEIAPQQAGPVEIPSDVEALEPSPCEEGPEISAPAEPSTVEEAMPLTGEPEAGLGPEPEPSSESSETIGAQSEAAGLPDLPSAQGRPEEHAVTSVEPSSEQSEPSKPEGESSDEI